MSLASSFAEVVKGIGEVHSMFLVSPVAGSTPVIGLMLWITPLLFEGTVHCTKMLGVYGGVWLTGIASKAVSFGWPFASGSWYPDQQAVNCTLLGLRRLVM